MPNMESGAGAEALGRPSVDAVLTRELEDVASAHAEELAGVPGLSMAMQWPAIS